MSNTVFINPSALMAEAQSYREAAEETGSVTYSLTPGITNMSSIMSYIDTLEAFNSFIGEFVGLAKRDASTLEWLRHEWGSFDEATATSFTT
jgi:hypothetical protein